ncbi:MAG TPA: hypothetical protein VFU49_03870 [Ktedonobacteraceae bacterium]|nr:hypothetical protein [Ktedonobacteraceae bacterium]
MKTTRKDTAMLVVIFSVLFSVTLLGALWFHDVWYPPEGRAERKQWSRSFDRVEDENKHNSQGVALLHPSLQGKETS